MAPSYSHIVFRGVQSFSNFFQSFSYDCPIIFPSFPQFQPENLRLVTVGPQQTPVKVLDVPRAGRSSLEATMGVRWAKVGGFRHPSEKYWSKSVGMMTFPTEWKNINVLNIITWFYDTHIIIYSIL